MAEFKQLIRLVDADLNGNKQVYHALRKIKGVSYSFANVVCTLANIDKTIKVGTLEEDKLKLLDNIIKNPSKYNIPSWMYNRRKDFDTGEDKHLLSSTLKLAKDFDIRRLKEIKSYKGIRHGLNLPVRGQRTKAHFRKGRAVGVKRTKGKGGGKKGK
ncbi:MAG: 30S ribosomal protein S13 [Candidatus Nanoarchaeia archaeon]|jgi:small subunit ribosomal protein S13|nr:30S ribosomal protein S13 [Candidatus Nanoarchaeia archaeon]|tara:strand:- start:11274 stop:11744 length:471 start_codon:yes stop_codon:yes gene_type:complete